MTDPFDPFEAARHSQGAARLTIEGEELVTLLRYRDVKQAAHDWASFTSNAPFRVPIPEEHTVRRVRQLPIETDPPAHRDYRQVVREPFGRSAAAKNTPAIRELVDAALDDATARKRIEVVREFALPLQSRALAVLLGRPTEDAEEWVSWGIHVFRDPRGKHGSELDAYLDRQLDRAEAEAGDDFFGLLVAGRFHGRRLTRDEMLGFANLVFAGGRDTLINLITNALHHLSRHPAALEQLRASPQLARTATEEFLRFYSPLTHIGRVVTRDSELHGCPISAGSRVALGFASANRDPTVFDRADECVLERAPNRHLAFGHGPHVCLGAPHTRTLATVLLERIALRATSLSIIEAVPALEPLGCMERQVGFSRLVIEVTE